MDTKIADRLRNQRGILHKWLNGYGFVSYEGRDVFVHRDAFLPNNRPEKGQLVGFDFGLAPDRSRPPIAINVRVLKTKQQVQAETEVALGLLMLQDQKVSQGGVQ
jgi:cold shock CspA family protein